MWNTIKNFFTNYRREIIAVVILILALGLLLSRCSSGNNATTYPGGGAGIMILAALASVGAAVRQSKGLWVVAGILWAIYLYPKAMAILSGWGATPSIALMLFLGVMVWIAKRGAGFLFWRGIVALVLLFAAIPLSEFINKGIEDIRKINISMPSISQSLKESFSRVSKSAEDFLEGKSEKFLAKSRLGKATDLAFVNKETAVIVEAGTAMYGPDLQFIGTADKRLVGTIGSEKKNLNGRFLCQVFFESGDVVFIDPDKIVFKAEAEAKAKAEAEAKAKAEAEAKAKAEAEAKAKAEAEAKKKAQGVEIVLEPIEDNGRYRQYRLPANTQVGDSFVLNEAIASRGFINIFVGTAKMGEYPKKVVPAKTVFLINERCNRSNDGNFYLAINSDYEIVTSPKIVVRHKKGGVF